MMPSVQISWKRMNLSNQSCMRSRDRWGTNRDCLVFSSGPEICPDSDGRQPDWLYQCDPYWAGGAVSGCTVIPNHSVEH